MHLSLSAKLGRLPILFSAPVRDYFSRLDAAGLRVGKYDLANAGLIDRLVGNGGNLWPASGAFNAMAGYLYPGNGEDLIPLKDGHDAGTLNNFVTGDWDAVTGLKGVPASSTYVNSNRANNADGQDDQCVGFYGTELQTTGLQAFFGAGISTGQTRWANGDATFCRTSTLKLKSAAVGFNAISRDNASDYDVRSGGTNQTFTTSSQTPDTQDIFVFCRNNAGAGIFTASRFAFYNAGPNLNGAGELAELDAALTEWKNALAAA